MSQSMPGRWTDTRRVAFGDLEAETSSILATTLITFLDRSYTVMELSMTLDRFCLAIGFAAIPEASAVGLLEQYLDAEEAIGKDFATWLRGLTDPDLRLSHAALNSPLELAAQISGVAGLLTMSGAVIVRRIVTAWRQIDDQRTRSSRQQAERAGYALAEQILREEIDGIDARMLPAAQKRRALDVSDKTVEAVDSTIRALSSVDLDIQGTPQD